MGIKTKKELQDYFNSIKENIINDVFKEYGLSNKSISGQSIINAFKKFDEQGVYEAPEETQELKIDRKRYAIQFTIDDLQKTSTILNGFELNTREYLESNAKEEYSLNLSNLKVSLQEIENNRPVKPREASIIEFNFDRPQAPEFHFISRKYDSARDQVSGEFNRIKNLTSVNGIKNYQGSKKQYGDLLKMYTELKKVNKSRGILESFFSFKKHRNEKNLLNEIKAKLSEFPFHDKKLNFDNIEALEQKNTQVFNEIFNEVDNNERQIVDQYNQRNLENYNIQMEKYNADKEDYVNKINDMENNPDKYKNEIIEKYYDDVIKDLVKENKNSKKMIDEYIDVFTLDDYKAFNKIAYDINEEMMKFEPDLRIVNDYDVRYDEIDYDPESVNVEETNIQEKDGLMDIKEFDDDLPIASNSNNGQNSQVNQNQKNQELDDELEF